MNGFSFEMKESFAGFTEIVIQAGINIWAEIRMKSLNRFFPIGRIMASEKKRQSLFPNRLRSFAHSECLR